MGVGLFCQLAWCSLQDYIDPFMTVLVADARANILDSRDTSACHQLGMTFTINIPAEVVYAGPRCDASFQCM